MRYYHQNKSVPEPLLPILLLKWYGHVRRMKEEHIVSRMLDVDIPGIRRGRPNLRWKDACKKTEVGLKEDKTTNAGQHGGIRPSAIPATPGKKKIQQTDSFQQTLFVSPFSVRFPIKKHFN